MYTRSPFYRRRLSMKMFGFLCQIPCNTIINWLLLSLSTLTACGQYPKQNRCCFLYQLTPTSLYFAPPVPPAPPTSPASPASHFDFSAPPSPLAPDPDSDSSLGPLVAPIIGGISGGLVGFCVGIAAGIVPGIAVAGDVGGMVSGTLGGMVGGSLGVIAGIYAFAEYRVASIPSPIPRQGYI
ncbi:MULTISPECIES: complement resistance protein TraT [unclassified Candidatus Cardinium]|uniref:complement resistance protein TraT n=1 Tax=unclassified Candidatus Cardinium TaxID=2641185 RepID=UPI001FB30BBB|nr:MULTISPECIES: complement resistance protein TraT [unclassified Candidatus Cardinium]